jgi:WD40 repeat protein
MNCRCRTSLCGIIVCVTLSILFICRSANADDRELPQAPITCIAITLDGSTVIDGSQTGIRVRLWSDMSVDHTVEVPCRNVHDVVLSPDESTLAVVGGNPGESAWVGFYSWPSRELLWSRSFSNDIACAVSFCSSGRLLAIGCHDHSVVLLESESGISKGTLTGHSRPVTVLSFVGSDTSFVSGSIDQSIRIWNYEQATVVRSLTNHTQPVTSLAVRPKTGEALPMIATGSEDKTVRLWQPTIGRMVRFQRMTSPVTALAWTKDGNAIVVGCGDGRIRLVQADTLQTTERPVVSNTWITAIAVHPTESMILAGDADGNIVKLPL